MKMTRIFFLTVCLILITNICQAEQYYCGDAANSYNCTNLYYSDQTAKQNCRWLKTDIIISDEPITYTYKQCINDYNAAKAKYEQGMCTPIITQIHFWNGYKCQVKSVQGTPIVIQAACDTNNSEVQESALYYFGKKYREQHGIYDVE